MNARFAFSRDLATAVGCLLAWGLGVGLTRPAVAEPSPGPASTPAAVTIEVSTLEGGGDLGPLRATYPELIVATPDGQRALAWAQILRVRVAGGELLAEVTAAPSPPPTGDGKAG